MELMIVVLWIVFSIIVGIAANTRGRNPVGWFILAILISPLLAGLIVLASKNNTVVVERFDNESGATYMVREKIRARTPEQDRERTILVRAMVIIIAGLCVVSCLASTKSEVVAPIHTEAAE